MFKLEVKGFKVILMVGCFLELIILWDVVKEVFLECLVVVLYKVSLVVFKGVVFIGYSFLFNNDRLVIEVEFLC